MSKKLYLALDEILNNFLKSRPLIFFFFLVLLLSLKSSVLNLLPYGDEMTYLNGTFKVLGNNLNPFIDFCAYKPPLFFMLAASTYKLFGYSILISHFIILLFSFLTLCFTFLLAEEIYNRTIALFASLLLFFSPFFFAQSILFYADNLVATLTIITIYFFFKNNKRGYFISAVLLVLTKELAVLLIIILGIYEVLINLAKPDKPSEKVSILTLVAKIAFRLSPLLFFSIWMVANKLILGWYIWPRHLEPTFNFKYSFQFFKVLYILKDSFFIQFRFLISIAILLNILLSIWKSEFRTVIIKKCFLLFIIIVFVYTITFASFSSGTPALLGLLPRYLIFIQPLFFIFGTAAITQLLKKKIYSATAFLIIIGFFISCWHSNVVSKPDLTLSYSNMVKAHEQVDKFLEKNFSGSTIVTNWPIWSQLSTPSVGYVTKPFSNMYWFDEVQTPGEIKNMKNTLIVLPGWQQFWKSQDFLDCSKNIKNKLVVKFGSDSAEIIIYSVN